MILRSGDARGAMHVTLLPFFQVGAAEIKCSSLTAVKEAPLSDWPCRMENQVSTWLTL